MICKNDGRFSGYSIAERCIPLHANWGGNGKARRRASSCYHPKVAAIDSSTSKGLGGLLEVFAPTKTPIVQRAAAIIGSAIFLVIAPGTLALYVPWHLTHWHFAPPLFPIARVLGAALIVAGLPILLDSFARFALQGLGTPAPVMPPKRLVVTGFYRYVRNPMYVAVTALIAGQGLLFGSVTVLEYGAIVWAGFFLFVVAYEEPALGEQFADEYKRYRANVRRWLPRITPWRG